MSKVIYFCLKNTPTFASVDQKVLDRLCAYAIKRLYKENEYVFKQGEVADTVYILQEGALKLFRVNEDGTETILNYLSPGEVVGDDAFFKQNVYNLTSCIAVKNSKICSINRARFEKLLMEEPHLMQSTIAKMVEHLSNLHQNVLGNKIMPAKEKLKYTFFTLGRDHGVQSEGGIRINLKITQQEIADLVGISRAVACQLISELVKEGFIDKNGRSYTILNKRLCHVCQWPDANVASST